MNIYLDICALKRPFDDQSQARISLETAAVVAILRLIDGGVLRALASPAHIVENDLNTNVQRASAINGWLRAIGVGSAPDTEVERSYRELRIAGLKSFDALHMAWARHLGAVVFVTTDDRLIAAVARAGVEPRAVNPITFLQEVRV